MESKNEEIHFWKRDSIHIIDLTQTLELTNVALEKYIPLSHLVVKFYLFQQKNKLQRLWRN